MLLTIFIVSHSVAVCCCKFVSFTYYTPLPLPLMPSLRALLAVNTFPPSPAVATHATLFIQLTRELADATKANEACINLCQQPQQQ